jgi:hypothetical protein
MLEYNYFTHEFILAKTPEFSLISIKNLLVEKEKQLAYSEYENPKLESQIQLLKDILNFYKYEEKIV